MVQWRQISVVDDFELLERTVALTRDSPAALAQAVGRPNVGAYKGKSHRLPTMPMEISTTVSSEVTSERSW
jgi:hypothetical protein